MTLCLYKVGVGDELALKDYSYHIPTYSAVRVVKITKTVIVVKPIDAEYLKHEFSIKTGNEVGKNKLDFRHLSLCNLSPDIRLKIKRQRITDLLISQLDILRKNLIDDRYNMDQLEDLGTRISHLVGLIDPPLVKW